MFEVTVLKKEIDKMLHTMQKQRVNMRPLMTRFYSKIHKEVLLNFRLQSAPPDIFTENPGDTRKPWAPISSYTATSRLANRKSTSNVGAILQASGLLRASMGKVREINNASMKYGTPSSISAAHHFGVTIRPVRAKYLALPYPGVTGRPREYTNTFFRGKTLYQSDGQQGLRPLFFLKDKVTLPARPHLTISNSTLNNMQDLTWHFLVKKTAGI